MWVDRWYFCLFKFFNGFANFFKSSYGDLPDDIQIF